MILPFYPWRGNWLFYPWGWGNDYFTPDLGIFTIWPSGKGIITFLPLGWIFTRWILFSPGFDRWLFCWLLGWLFRFWLYFIQCVFKYRRGGLEYPEDYGTGDLESCTRIWGRGFPTFAWVPVFRFTDIGYCGNGIPGMGIRFWFRMLFIYSVRYIIHCLWSRLVTVYCSYVFCGAHTQWWGPPLIFDAWILYWLLQCCGDDFETGYSSTRPSHLWGPHSMWGPLYIFMCMFGLEYWIYLERCWL